MSKTYAALYEDGQVKWLDIQTAFSERFFI